MKIEFNRFVIASFVGLFLSCFAGLASAAGGMITLFGIRGTVTPTTPMYGSFELVNTSVIYIVVRGQSLQNLGFTQRPLDLPNVRVYDASGNDLLTSQSGGVTVSGCPSTGNSSTVPVFNYYANLGQPLDVRDTCLSRTFAAGYYTFTINPNTSTSTGELLFEVRVNPVVTETNYTKSAKLIGGAWIFSYKIISTFTDGYSFTSISPTPNASGNYSVHGNGIYGEGAVVGGYVSSGNFWSVLDPGTIIDQYFTFSFTDDNHVSGCYYLIDPPGSLNLSRCYQMTGYRTFNTLSLSLKSGSIADAMQEVKSDTRPVVTDPSVVESYLDLRSEVQ